MDVGHMGERRSVEPSLQFLSICHFPVARVESQARAATLKEDAI